MIHFKFTEKDTRYLFLKYDDAADLKILRQLQKYVNLVNPICYLPSYKGPPYTEDFLWEYHRSDGTMLFYSAIGMWQIYYKWFTEYNIPFDGLEPQWFKRNIQHSFEEFKEIVNSWGLKFNPRPYQYEAAYKILQWNHSVSELATRAGKTLISYVVFRYAMEYLGVKKILMIVPSIDLVKQAYSDFNEYKEFFKTECIWSGGKLVQSANLTVGTYQSLIKFIDRTSNKFNPSFFNGYDLLFVDETHRATANQIKTLISQPFMKEVKIAFGMTGTVPKEHTIERYILHSLLGAKIQEIKPAELIEEGFISPVKIYQHRLNYISNKEAQITNWIKCAEYCLGEDVEYKEVQAPKFPKEPIQKKRETDDAFAERYAAWVAKCESMESKTVKRVYKREDAQFLIQNVKHLPDGLVTAKAAIWKKHNQQWTIDALKEYKKLLEVYIKEAAGANMLHVEVMMNHLFPERVDYLINLLKQCPYNTLVLAQHREYIKYVYDKVVEAFPDRKVMYVIGGSADRKTCKEALKQNDNCILIAGYGIMSTGITLNNLAYEVLYESYKSTVVNVQSIGRTLGLSKPEGITQAVIHDITDVYDKKMASQKILGQGKERLKIYDDNKFPYEILNINI